MARLVLLAGKKGSGKDTLGKYVSERLSYLGLSTRVYHFADPLKQFCVDYLYLDPKLVWGTDQDKETPTLHLWQNLPHYQDVLLRENLQQYCETNRIRPLQESVEKDSRLSKFYGYMTVRQVLQEYGTGNFRKINQNYWVDRLLRQIEQEKNDVSIVCDCRFPSEIEVPKVHCGENVLTVRLTRNIKPGDTHPSETALDGYADFDVVLDNANQTLEVSQNQLLTVVGQWLEK